MAHGGVAVEVDRAGGFEDAVHFQHPHRHVGEIGLVGVGHGDEQHPVQDGMARFHEVDPFGVHVPQRPGVLERRARRGRADRGGVVGFAVERRIKIDQINRFAVHATHHIEIVAGPDRLIRPVRLDRSHTVIRSS